MAMTLKDTVISDKQGAIAQVINLQHKAPNFWIQRRFTRAVKARERQRLSRNRRQRGGGLPIQDRSDVRQTDGPAQNSNTGGNQTRLQAVLTEYPNT